MSRDIYSPFLGRSYPDPVRAVDEWAAQALGECMAAILGAPHQPGPAYTLTTPKSGPETPTP